ncbi:hypothetical protein K160097B7_36350 [[Clostridium] hylemonae]
MGFSSKNRRYYQLKSEISKVTKQHLINAPSEGTVVSTACGAGETINNNFDLTLRNRRLT